MKIVQSNSSQVLHLWANQTKSEGRCDNVSFRGPCLFSYAAHIATIIKTKRVRQGCAVLITEMDYSVTTKCHKSGARWAATQYPIFEVPSIGDRYTGQRVDHKANLAHFKSQLEKSLLRASRSRRYAESYIQSAERIIAHANEYAAIFGLKTRLKMPDDTTVEALRERVRQQRIKQQEALKKLNEERRKAEVEYRQKYFSEILPAWKNGINGEHLPRRDPDGFDHLRLRGSRIQTTSGAVVTVDQARAVLPLVRAGELRQWPSFAGNAPAPVVDGFRVSEVGADGTLTIGCHKIKREDIEEIAKQLGM